MGIFDRIKKIFKKESDNEAIESDSKRLNSDLNRLNSDSKRFKAIESDLNRTINGKKYINNYEELDSGGLKQVSHPFKKEKEDKESLELQKESLQLGVAAGYTGKSLREIESSLNRIESNMTSRDWFLSNFGDKSSKNVELLLEIKKKLENHDASALDRLSAIESALNRMYSVANNAPGPVKDELIKEIGNIESNLPPTPKMKELVDVVKDKTKVSYDDLADNLDITRSSLRGLLSNTIKRTNRIERFSIDGRGWVRYKHPKTTQIDDLIE